MPENQHDIAILRDLARQYMDLAAKPIQEERRALWRAHFSLKRTRVPILITYGMVHYWCRQVFGDHQMRCQDPFYREHERTLRMQIYHDAIGDDYILEPWLTQGAVHRQTAGIYGQAWGVVPDRAQPPEDGGSWKSRPFIVDWEDMHKLVPPHHQIDEEATARDVARLRAAVGDIIPVNVERGPLLSSYAADISTTLGQLRGLHQLMLDMYEAPQRLHALLAFLRDGILANQQEAEDAGDYGLTSQFNGAMPYAEELETRRANAGPRKRADLWGFCAAQEFTLVSPRFHEQFLFQYQLPIMERFGLVHYGCCEDLERKIGMLRQLKNLRSIVVGPTADVTRFADQAGRDYVLAWRPNVTDLVSSDWDEERIRHIIGRGLRACRECNVYIHLECVETVQGDPARLGRWVQVAREVADAASG